MYQTLTLSIPPTLTSYGILYPISMCVCQAVMRSSPIVVALATFAAYVLSGHQLDAQTAFTSLALFGTIAHPFHVLPKVKGKH